MVAAEFESTSNYEEIVFEVDAKVKKEFLEKQLKSTREFYAYVLKKADEFEVKIEKKIYDFNISERDELLIVQYKNKNKWTFQTALSPLKTYVDFCISKSLVRHNENRFSTILPSNYYEYINLQAQENSYIPLSKNREEIQSRLANYQDKLMLDLLGLGVRGRTEKGNTLEELVNLKVSDIKWGVKKLYLTKNDIPEKRYINVDDYALNLLRKTIDSTFYISNNGLKTKPNDEGVYERTEKGRAINPTEYVFRTPGRTKHGKVTSNLFVSRIQRIQSWLEFPYLTVSSLYFSSIIDYAKKLKDEKGEKGELNRLDYIRINEQFSFGETGDKYVFKVKELINQYLD